MLKVLILLHTYTGIELNKCFKPGFSLLGWEFTDKQGEKASYDDYSDELQ